MNNIKEIIASGLPTVGIFQVIPSTILSEGLAKLGFDWIMPDLQHGGINWDGLLEIIQAIDLGGKQALVRVSSNDPTQIMRALDLGALGVVIPLVSTAAEAELAAKATRYPPLGNRSLGPTRRMYNPGGLAQWIEMSNRDVLCLVMIETAEAMNNLEEIAATPGVDGLFVGLADLTLSLGLEISQIGDPEVKKTVDRIIAVCEKNKIIPGSVAFGEGPAADLISRGMRLIALGSDFGLIAEGAARHSAAAAEWKVRFARQAYCK